MIYKPKYWIVVATFKIILNMLLQNRIVQIATLDIVLSGEL